MSPHRSQFVSLQRDIHLVLEHEERFDVAISFAGEQRDLAKRINRALRRREYSVFFDEQFLNEMIGVSLSEYLERVFATQSNHCVMILSQDYVNKPYPRHEKKAILSRLLVDEGYIIPIRTDDAVIPGLPTDTCYIDARTESVRSIVSKICARIEYIRAARVNNPRRRTEESVPPAEIQSPSADSTALPEDVCELLDDLRSKWNDKLLGCANGQEREDLFFSLLEREVDQIVNRVQEELEQQLKRVLERERFIERFGPTPVPIAVSARRVLFDTEPEVIQLMQRFNVIRTDGHRIVFGREHLERFRRNSEIAQLFAAYR